MVNFYSLNNMPISRFNGSNSVIPGTFKRWGGTNLYSAQYNFINNYNMGSGPQMFGGYDYGCCNNNDGGFFGKLGDWLMGAGIVGGLVGGLMSLFGGKKTEGSGQGATSDTKPTQPVETEPTPTQAPAIKNGVYSASAGKIDGKDMNLASTFNGLEIGADGLKVKDETQDDGLDRKTNIGSGENTIELTDKEGKLKPSVTITTKEGDQYNYTLNTEKYAIKDGKKYPIYTLKDCTNKYLTSNQDDYIVINGHFEQLNENEYTTASSDGQMLNGVAAKAVTLNQEKVDSDTAWLNKANKGKHTGALEMQNHKFKAIVNGSYIDSKEYDTQNEAEKAAREAKNAPTAQTPKHEDD